MCPNQPKRTQPVHCSGAVTRHAIAPRLPRLACLCLRLSWECPAKASVACLPCCRSFLNIATLAAAAFATLAVPAPCELLESAHLCRVQLQAGLTPQGCATRSPALPCAWGWSRYIELQPPALIDFHDLPPSLAGLERALERLPQLHPIKGAAQGAAKGTAEAAEAEAGAKAESPVSSGHTLHSAPYTAVPSSREGGSCAGCTADLAQSQPTTMVASSRPQQAAWRAAEPRAIALDFSYSSIPIPTSTPT